MHPLNLSLLPTLRAERNDAPGSWESEGFVDEAVVAALVKAPAATRKVNYEHLALSADDNDFAGWSLSTQPVIRAVPIPVSPAPTSTPGRATPPELREPEIGPSRGSAPGRWLACLTGVFTSLLLAAILLGLADHPAIHPEKSGARPLDKGANAAADPKLSESSELTQATLESP